MFHIQAVSIGGGPPVWTLAKGGTMTLGKPGN